MDATVTRRTVLGATVGVAGLMASGRLLPGARAWADAAERPLRQPESLPHPARPAGTPDPGLPFDHIVVVMQENHSFDNYLGMLPVRGQPLADGFTFDAAGRPVNRNPFRDGHLTSYRLPSTCQSRVTQSWDSTHRQINGGRMDGFAATSVAAMGYYDEPDLPFYYSLAKTFTLANRWFSSVPGPTYPNRRFLYAGTAYGNISTDSSAFFDGPPPNGTLVDRLSTYGISWAGYFADLPVLGIIPSQVSSHPANARPIAEFFVDAAAGTLPAVCFVDGDQGLLNEAGSQLAGQLKKQPGVPPQVLDALTVAGPEGQDEENPQDVRLGEAHVARVVNAVLRGPGWARTLLVWTYDEHGGYYDHVPPPPAAAPDDIAPKLGPANAAGGYDRYGVRVPAVVVSPYSRPHAVTNVVHDHTSVLAMVERVWNLPALTHRDANASDLLDFVDLSRPAFPDPPALEAAPMADVLTCSTAVPAPAA